MQKIQVSVFVICSVLFSQVAFGNATAAIQGAKRAASVREMDERDVSYTVRYFNFVSTRLVPVQARIQKSPYQKLARVYLDLVTAAQELRNAIRTDWMSACKKNDTVGAQGSSISTLFEKNHVTDPRMLANLEEIRAQLVLVDQYCDKYQHQGHSIQFDPRLEIENEGHGAASDLQGAAETGLERLLDVGEGPGVRVADSKGNESAKEAATHEKEGAAAYAKPPR